MNKYSIIQKIEEFAPIELAENWDCSGWGVETANNEVKKVMLALTVTDNVVNQAKKQNCDMIISHHPLFFVPMKWKDIDIYSAHTNLDKAKGGTTDTLISELNLQERVIANEDEAIQPFLRYVQLEKSLKIEGFIKKLQKISPNLRYVNNFNMKEIKKIAFCAGSGSDFIEEAYANGADAFVTGDLKFHTALDSPIVVFDIGHFESEILVLRVFERLLDKDVDVVFAEERSPFSQIKC